MNTVAELLQERASAHGHVEIYRFLSEQDEFDGGRTFAELDRAARRVAALLQGLHARGERVLLCFDPGTAFIEAFLGCAYAGAIAVPAYPPKERANYARLQAIAEDCSPLVALYDQRCEVDWERVRGAGALAAVQFVPAGDLPLGSELFYRHTALSADALCFLQYTSGSTGSPKGVKVSHGNLLHNLQAIHRTFALSPDDLGMFWLPPFHDMGLIGGLLQPLYARMPSLLASPSWFVRRPERWLRTIARHGVTVSGAPTFAYALCTQRAPQVDSAQFDLSKWSLAFMGAEPVRDEVMEAFAKLYAPFGFRRSAFLPCYGMAEATLLVTGVERAEPPRVAHLGKLAHERDEAQVSLPGAHTRRSVGCGQAGEGLTVVVVEPTTREALPEGRVGEVWVHGASVAQGYWNKAELSEERFRAVLASGPAHLPRGPYLRTGDKGMFVDGQLHIAGRLKDMVIVRGRNYYAEDIEAVAAAAHPLLRPNGGAAFGVDADGVERVVLVHELSQPTASLQDVAAAIEETVLRELGLAISDVALIPKHALPRTTSGKVMRFAAREAFLSGTLALASPSARVGTATASAGSEPA